MNTNQAPARFPGTYPTHPNDIELGSFVRDRVSGLEGVAMAKVEYLTGCTQICIAPMGLTAEGKLHEGTYLDWQRIEIMPNETKLYGLSDLGRSAATLSANGAGEPPRSTTGLRV